MNSSNEHETCRLCQVQCDSLKALFSHVNHATDHPTWANYKVRFNIKPKRESIFNCPHCDKKDLRYTSYLVHLKRHNVEGPPPSSSLPIKLRLKMATRTSKKELSHDTVVTDSDESEDEEVAKMLGIHSPLNK